MKLELYKKKTCPFCQRVLSYLETSGRTDVTFADIIEVPGAEERLIEIGGKRQVPCLVIDGEPLYESLDIIQWLKEHPQA